MKNFKIILCLFITFSVIANNKQADKELEVAKYNWQMQQDFNNKKYSKAGSDFVTVGLDSQCDFSTGAYKLQNAINSGASEIRLVSDGVFQEKIALADQDVSIRGGFATCFAAENNQQTDIYAELVGSLDAGLSGVMINTNTTSRQVVLERINISGHKSNYYGGGMTVTSPVNLALNNVNIYGNVSVGRAGGIYLINNDATVVLYNSFIFDNEGSEGGGLYCSGTNSTVSLYSGSGISFNRAYQGGGVNLQDSCQFFMYSGSEGLYSLSGIAYNKAETDGGGFYIESGAKITLNGNLFCISQNACFGDTSNPVNVNNNRANYVNDGTNGYVGGAIYIDGSGYPGSDIASATLSGVLFKDNVSGGSGGAIYATSSAQLTIKQNNPDCWFPSHCNVFSGNKTAVASATSIFNGGAIYTRNIDLDVSNAYFENNRAAYGAAIYFVGGSSAIESSVFSRNGFYGSGGYADNNVIYLGLDADVSIVHSTFADNYTQNATVEGFSADRLNVAASIIYDSYPDNTLGSIGAVIKDYNCLVVSKLPLYSGTNIIVANPSFVDPASKDYHINNNSPAIDLCGNNFPQHSDMDQESYGWNNPDIPNQGGVTFNTYDAGADEKYNEENIFFNGFE